MLTCARLTRCTAWQTSARTAPFICRGAGQLQLQTDGLAPGPAGCSQVPAALVVLACIRRASPAPYRRRY
eukprot:365579-Chlamydomonas_euryale.AAC.1